MFYLLEVYPPKDFSYHLLTKYCHQYLKDGVVNNFAVKLRKSWKPENFQECWLCSTLRAVYFDLLENIGPERDSARRAIV